MAHLYCAELSGAIFIKWIAVGRIPVRTSRAFNRVSMNQSSLLFKVFVNNRTLAALTYLSALCFSRGVIISCVWDTLVFQYAIINQYI